MIVAGKMRHRVAVIGQSVFGTINEGELELETAEVGLFHQQQAPEIDELYNYTLVITDFEGIDNNQEFFAKRMFEALERGTNFCFVHYDHEGTQNRPLSVNDGQVNALYKRQVGLQAIWDKQIKTFKADAAFKSGVVRVNEFKGFLERYGASYDYFFSEQGFDTEIYTAGENNLVLGFSINSGKGKIIVLPFMRDFARPVAIKNGLRMLIDAVLTFITDSLVEMPNWAIETPFFADEEPLFEKRMGLQQELGGVNESIAEFKQAKSLLLQRKYTLENAIPRFLKDNLGVDSERDEQYKEDFWLLDASGSKVAIGEVKSLMKGFKESTIYSVVTHRDDYELDLAFPALLVVNCNLQAGSWTDKDQPLDINDCKFAANKNVLIVRVEDLLRLWNAMRLGTITSAEILQLLVTKKGWLRVKPNLQIEVSPELKSSNATQLPH